jgi:hypothetical protein
VGVRSLAGTWDGQSGDGDSFVVQMTQTGTILSGDVDGVPIDGTVNNDHWVMLGTTCGTRFEGFVSNDATQIDGSGDLPCRQYSSPQLLTFR